MVMGATKANIWRYVWSRNRGGIFRMTVFVFLDHYLGQRETLVMKMATYRWQTYTAGIPSLSALANKCHQMEMKVKFKEKTRSLNAPRNSTLTQT